MAREKKESIAIESRNSSLDLLRICAAAMVVMLHVAASYWYSLSPSSVEWKIMNFYDSFVRSSVPIFFMLSGAFMLKKDISLKELYLKKIIPLGIIYLVWSFLYAVDVIGLDGITASGIKGLLRAVIGSHYHLWFIPTLIGIYMLQPILRAIVNYENGKNVKYLIIIFFVFGIVRYTSLLFITKNAVRVLITKVPVELMSYSGYVIMGHFFVNMNKRRFKPWIMLLGFIVVAAIATIICQISALNKGEPEGILYEYFSLPSFLEALFLFLFFINLKINYSIKMRTVLYRLSTLTLGVYLLHPFVLTQLDAKLGINTLSFNTFFAIPINTVLIVMICFAVTSIMIKIPVVKKLWQF